MKHCRFVMGVLLILMYLCSCGDKSYEYQTGIYSGGWSSGKPEGYGRYLSAKDSIIYEGGWHDGSYQGYGRLEKKDTVYYGYFVNGRRHGEGTLTCPDGLVYSGTWKNDRRDGYGEIRNVKGRHIKGIWKADTLSAGVCSDSSGIYRGALNAELQAEGEGEYTDVSGHYFTGNWHAGLKDGFGFAVAPRDVVKCGIWRKDRFQGEQMLYNMNRVYGIDISKYQHRIGRKVYSIDWSDLRITNLGHISKKKIDGVVDYPVSFIYIKATEGQTVVNPYYAKDIRDARRHGYAVGAYHFMSLRPAFRQAAFFLKKARPQKGDLPPMLDVELTDGQIKSMGGVKVLFEEILVWLRTVERHCHTVPVLYISQEYVNKYIPLAPDELKKYPIWIARYGEYKPYVHLQYWQLSPDGKVKGIHGDVDINVYNGLPHAFDDYVHRSVVK